MGAVAAALGQGATVELDGVEYTLSPWTFEIQGLFERYLERQAIDTYRRMSGVLTEDEAAKALSTVLQDIAMGVYTFGTQVVSKALEAPIHVTYMIFLMLKKTHSDITREDVRNLAKKHYKALLQAINQANADPNQKKESLTSEAVKNADEMPKAPVPSSPQSATA